MFRAGNSNGFRTIAKKLQKLGLAEDAYTEILQKEEIYVCKVDIWLVF